MNDEIEKRLEKDKQLIEIIGSRYFIILSIIYIATPILLWVLLSKYIGDDTAIGIVGNSLIAAILIKIVLHYFRNKFSFYRYLINKRQAVFGYIFIIALIFFSFKSYYGAISEFNRLVKLSEEGDIQATYDLAYHYEVGIGTPINNSNACLLYQKLVDQNVWNARTDLGIMNKRLLCSGSLEEQTKKAFNLLKANADRQEPRALYEIGKSLEATERYREQGLYYLQQAADLGHAAAKKFLKQRSNRKIIGDTLTKLCKYETCEDVSDYLVNEMK